VNPDRNGWYELENRDVEIERAGIRAKRITNTESVDKTVCPLCVVCYGLLQQ